MKSGDEERIYQRIGEFVVIFQWIENKLREIGWYILDPDRSSWPPTALRELTNHDLIEKVHELFRDVILKCQLEPEMEAEFTNSFAANVGSLHQLRRDRNREVNRK